MTQQRRQRAVHAAVCALSLAAIVALTVRQTGPHHGRIIAQLSFLGGRGGGGGGSGNDTDAGMPASWASPTPTSRTPTSRSPTSPTPTSRTPTSPTPPSPPVVLDPFNELSQWRNSTSPAIVYPSLYKSLTRLTQPAGSLASSLISGPTKTGVPPCKRPAGKNLAHLLSQPTNSFSYKRPHPGGFWSPEGECWPPLSRTAVLVPYRNRSQNLDLFVPYMQTLLQQQGIVYGIFVIEQANTKLFNRAKLLNIGFKVSQQFGQFDCFVFQDADKVPENVANVYNCVNAPKLMVSEMRPQLGPKSKQYNKGRFYHNFFGASVAMTKQAFERVNGNSNRYYGWGREDDELAARLSVRGFRINYSSGTEARFVNLHHSHDIVTNSMPWPYAHKVRGSMDTDGLNSLSYGDKGIFVHDLFVLIRADV